VDWRKIDRNLCETYHLTPRQIDEMTLTEIALLMEDAQAMSKKTMSDAEMLEALAGWQAKTNLEKLREAKRVN
jgi:hypothetical protein